MSTPKYNKVEVSIESKGLIQNLRKSLKLSEKLTIEAVLIAALADEARLSDIAATLKANSAPAVNTETVNA